MVEIKLGTMEKILADISKKHFNKHLYVDKVLSDETFRDLIVKNMIEHPKIMTYYHCFYIVSEASIIQPKLFYKYWDDMYQLLDHKNSYHRDFGLIILSNLASVDDESKFEDIIDRYLELLHDEKLMTAEVCLKNCAKVASVKPGIREKILFRLFEFESSIFYSEKQKALMMSHIINSFELLINNYPNKSRFIEFAKRHVNSISPKTRNIAKLFVKKHS